MAKIDEKNRISVQTGIVFLRQIEVTYWSDNSTRIQGKLTGLNKRIDGVCFRCKKFYLLLIFLLT
jgi:hypothetical protein